MTTRASRSGLSLLELFVAMTVLSVVVLNAGVATLSSLRTSRVLQDEQRIFERGRELLRAVASLRYETTARKVPEARDVERLFASSDASVPVTLSQLATAQPLGQWSFRIADFDPPGVWTVVVDHDLNDDGFVEEAAGRNPDDRAASPTVEQLETTKALVRIVVRFDGCDVVRTVRGRDRGDREVTP